MQSFRIAGVALGLMIALTAGQARAGTIDVLWYNGVSGAVETDQADQVAAENLLATPGIGDSSSASWNISHWYDGAAKPGGDFKVLVIGSRSGVASGSLLAALPAFGNRIFVTGQDADYHLAFGPGADDFNGPRGLLRNAINWAAAGAGLGVVVLSPGEGSVSLAELGIAGITNDIGFTDKVTIPDALAAYPVNAGLTSSGLSGWTTSSHDKWANLTAAWTGISTDSRGRFITLVSHDEAAGSIAGTSVPEPASALLVGVGLLALMRRRRA